MSHAYRRSVGFAANEDHAAAEPLVALEVEFLELGSGKARGEFIGLLGGRALPEAADGDDVAVATVHHLIGVEPGQRFELPGEFLGALDQFLDRSAGEPGAPDSREAGRSAGVRAQRPRRGGMGQLDLPVHRVERRQFEVAQRLIDPATCERA